MEQFFGDGILGAAPCPARIGLPDTTSASAAWLFLLDSTVPTTGATRVRAGILNVGIDLMDTHSGAGRVLGDDRFIDNAERLLGLSLHKNKNGARKPTRHADKRIDVAHW